MKLEWKTVLIFIYAIFMTNQDLICITPFQQGEQTRNLNSFHCIKSVRIRRFSSPYLVRMRENTDQKNSTYEHFSSSV